MSKISTLRFVAFCSYKISLHSLSWLLVLLYKQKAVTFLPEILQTLIVFLDFIVADIFTMLNGIKLKF